MQPTTSFTLRLILAALPCAPGFAQGGLADLGTLGGTVALATGVSADGSLVVGSAARAGGEYAAFRWSAGAGMQELGSGALLDHSALGVSADGRFAYGIVFLGSNRQAFRWSNALGFERLGSLGANAGQPATATVPFAISDDGSVIVGWSLSTQGALRAFRWTDATGLVDLGTLGGSTAEALYVSGDGAVVVGQTSLASGEPRGFRWEASTGMVDLGTLGGNATIASGVNLDGSVIVGYSHTPLHVAHAFRWTAATGLVDLGALNGVESFATAVSADGNAIAGTSTFGPSSAVHAFHWTAALGMRDLGTLGGLQSFVSGLSADGQVVVGTSVGPVGLAARAFRWTSIGGMKELGTFGGEHSTPTGVSADGAVIVGSSTTAGPAATNHAFRWELGAVVAIGARTCANGVANSTGALGRIEALGSNALALNDLVLSAQQLPLQSIGFFLASLTTDERPAAGGGQGTLCLGGAIGRFVGPGQVMSTGQVGSFALAVDVTALPQPLGSVTARFGDTWHFQAWHRDSAAGVATSNLTDAVAVTMR